MAMFSKLFRQNMAKAILYETIAVVVTLLTIFFFTLKFVFSLNVAVALFIIRVTLYFLFEAYWEEHYDK